MGHIYKASSVMIRTTHDHFAFVVGLDDLNGNTIERILYDAETKQIQIDTTEESISLNARQTHFDINGNMVRCSIHVGSLTGEYISRPSPPPPLKRRPPTGYYNPLTGESFQAEQLYNQAELKRKESELENLKNQLKAEKSNLEKQLDSMRKAYQAEELENRNLRQMIEELNGGASSQPSTARYDIERKERTEIMLQNSQRQTASMIQKNNYLENELNKERQVSGYLHEDTRTKFMAWGVGLTTYQIVDLLFRFLA